MRCSGENGSYKQEWKGQQKRRAGVEVKGGYEWLKKTQKHSNMKWTTLETPMRLTSHTGLSKPIENLDFHLVPSYPFPGLHTNEQTQVLEKWITPISS